MSPRFNRFVCWIAASFVFCVPIHAQDFERGKAIFAQQCANCHGEHGQGVSAHFDQPLVGDLSVVELAKVIQETMPEEAPKSLSDEDSKAVASFVHHEFYSSMAQLRNAPPKVELTHLTVDQFRQSVADLMATFHGRPQAWTDARGLNRKIHQGDWGKDRKEVESRVDGQLVFDWGDKRPLPEIDHEKWQINWDGSIFAPTTGVYEFYLDANIRSRLNLNHIETSLIDAAVVSFESTLNTASVFLVGGHSYNINIEASRSKEPSARFSLEWKMPGGVRGPIPVRYLSPTWSPTLLIASTSFPPDDSSIGYERGRSVSREWYEATTAAAIEVSRKLTENLKHWMPHDDKKPNDREAVKKWCQRWVSIALRHKLSDEERQIFVDRHFENDNSIENAVKRVAILTLTSAEFLYPSAALTEDDAVVAHLALSLWDSVPEEWMLDIAAKRECHSPEQISNLVDRMVGDSRFKNKIRGFFYEFLGVRHLKELSKDTEKYPEFNALVASDLRTSFDLFLDDIANDPSRDLRELLTADYLYLNGRLATLYGIELPEQSEFQKVPVPREQRAGVLSHPYLMSGLAYHASSSPIHRGVFLAKRVLGRSLRPPVDAIIPVPEAAAPDLTTRERVANQTSGAMCQSCHRIINPLGFTLEHYDALGRFRENERGRIIDASGQYITTSGEQVQFRGVREMADFLSGSEEFSTSVVRQLFQYLVKQPLAAYGVDNVVNLDDQFAAEGYAIKPLVKRLVLLSVRNPNNVVADTNNPSTAVTKN